MKKIIGYLFLFALPLLFSQAFAQTNNAANAKLPIDPNVKIGTLSNGLKYYIRKNSKPENRAELRLVVHAGSMQEDEDQLGLAHFVEHMAFNGTKNFAKSELVDFLESSGIRFGADLNAYTSFDETVYMLTLPTDSPTIFKKGFQVLEEWAHNVAFDPEEIDKERGVVIEEWRLGRGAEARMRDRYFSTLLSNSRYAKRLPIGTLDILQNFKHETLIRFYKDWYRPDLMSIIAVGDFDVAEVETLIKKQFSGIKPVAKPRKKLPATIPDHKETLVAIETDPEAQFTRVNVYYKQPVFKTSTELEYRQGLVHTLFNSMLNARIAELQQQANPPFLAGFSSYGGFIGDKDAFTIGAVTRDGNFKNALNVVLSEALRLEAFGFTPTELERAKKSMLNSIERAFSERDKTESYQYAEEYVRNYLRGESIPGLEYEYGIYQKYVNGIDISEVNKLAVNWIGEDNRVVVITAPEAEKDKLLSKEEIIELLDNTSKLTLTPYVDKVSSAPLVAKLPTPSKVVSEKKMDEIGVTEWTLANGAKVVIKPTTFKNDEILFAATSPGGHSLYSDKDYLDAAYAPQILQLSGLGEFGFVELQKYLSGKVARLSPSIGEISEGLSGNTTPKDLETFMQLLYSYFTQPRADSVSFMSFSNSISGILANRGANPEAVFSDSIQAIISNYNVRRMTPVASQFQQLDLQNMYRIFKERFNDAGDFTFIFVGNINPEMLKPLVELYIGGIPSIGKKENFKDLGIVPPKGVVKRVVKKGTEPKSRVQLVFSGDFDWKTEEVFAISALQDVLDIKLRESLREDAGGVYGVGINAVPSKLPTGRYTVNIGFGCAPENVDKLVGLVFEEINKLKKDGATTTDLQKVIEIDKRDRETSLKENRFWIGQLNRYYSLNENPLSLLDFEKNLEKVTTETVKKAANKYLNEKNYIKVVLMPEN